MRVMIHHFILSLPSHKSRIFGILTCKTHSGLSPVGERQCQWWRLDVSETHWLFPDIGYLCQGSSSMNGGNMKWCPSPWQGTISQCRKKSLDSEHLQKHIQLWNHIRQRFSSPLFKGHTCFGFTQGAQEVKLKFTQHCKAPTAVRQSRVWNHLHFNRTLNIR